MKSPVGAVGTIKQAIATHSTPDSAKPYLERLQLLNPKTVKEKMIKKLIVAELTTEGFI